MNIVRDYSGTFVPSPSRSIRFVPLRPLQTAGRENRKPLSYKAFMVPATGIEPVTFGLQNRA